MSTATASAGHDMASVKAKAYSGGHDRKGQTLVDQGIGIMVAVVVIGAVAIPVVSDVVEDVNVSGMAGDILGYVELALALGLFVAAISIIR